MITLESFGLKSGVGPTTQRPQIDCRVLKNPHHRPDLKALDGRDPLVLAFIQDDPAFPNLLASVVRLAKRHQAICTFCYGGKHRSVAVAYLAAEALRREGFAVNVTHLNLPD